MSWDSDSTLKTKADVVAERLRLDRWTPPGKVLAHTVTPSGLWVVWELTSGERFIELSMIQRWNNALATKTIEERTGPAYYDCPASFLELVPEVHAEWRAKVRAYKCGKEQRITGGTKRVP